MAAGLPIYVDFDDVLCQTARGFVALLAREFGREVAFDDIVDFDLAVSFGLGPADLERFLALAHEPDVLMAMDPIAGAIETLRRWRSGGEEIAIVTGRPPDSEEVSRCWLEHHSVPYDSLLFVDKYDRGGDDGAVPLAALEPGCYRFAVEDSLSTARFLGAELELAVFLLDRPWNRVAAAEPAGVTRCSGWHDVSRESAVEAEILVHRQVGGAESRL